MKFNNSKGQIFYGMHFYPGVAEYREPDKNPHRVFLNESTLRQMDASFAGRPVYVQHVDTVSPDLNVVREDADGWVVESFFNAADGKHWVKFIAVSDKALRAIKNGLRLSNAYIPSHFAGGGEWNGVAYEKQITAGEFEHLAIVDNPRYDESVILTPEQFKQYNEEQTLELKRISNAKEKEPAMKLNLWKKAKVENSADLEGMVVTLPKSGKEIELTKLITNADEMAEKEGKEQMANGDHMVEVGSEKMKVNDLVKKHMDCMNELSEMKKSNEDGEDMDDESMDNEEDEDAKKKALELAEHEEKEIVEAKKKNEEAEGQKLKNAADRKKNFNKLKNAQDNVDPEPQVIELTDDKIARGQARYGS